VDPQGDDVGARVMGLLLSNGGTVCDDKFNNNSADAVCREMGYFGKMSWESGSKWGIQSRYDILLDDVNCTADEWSSCTFQFIHDCSHGEDVFLQCDGVGEHIK
jgi:hypothetical protein